MRSSLAAAMMASLLLLLARPLPAAAARAGEEASIVSLEGRAFDLPLRLETLAAPGAEQSLRAALAAVHELEAASHPDHGALRAFNDGGAAPRPLPPVLRTAVTRALHFCRWSDGAVGPLGASLYELWGLRSPRPALPTAEAIAQAVAAAACDRLVLDGTGGVATLAAGSRVDLWGFALGAAVDAGLDALAARGVRDASLTLGSIQRAVGGGPAGRGWPLRVAVLPALRPFTDTVMLRDQALATVTAADRGLHAGGEIYPPYLDQRTGRPTNGVLATVVVTTLAIDAQGVAMTLFATGTRRGNMLLGQLRPSPSALWALGDGSGEPLVSDYRWGWRQRRGDR